MRFPKEKPEHIRLLNEANSLLAKSGGDADKLREAYDMVCKCADEKSPRGNFFKACILYVDEAQTGDYEAEIKSALSFACKAKYPLADTVMVDYLFSLGNMDVLYKYLNSVKGNSPSASYYEGGFLAGYVETSQRCKKNLSKACACFEKSADTYIDFDCEYRNGCVELSDILVSVGNERYFLEQAGFAYQMLMMAYGDIDDKANKQSYITAYNNAQCYGNAAIKYKTVSLYANDCMNNIMGMYSLKTVNSLMNLANAKFEALSPESQENLQEQYDTLWKDYDDFYEYEMQRLEALGNMDIVTSVDYGKQQSLSVSQVASVIGDGLMRWANTPQEKTEYTITYDNKQYKLNSLGEMVDDYGQRNGLRVDTISKIVYNSKNDAVGFFDGFGYFHTY